MNRINAPWMRIWRKLRGNIALPSIEESRRTNNNKNHDKALKELSRSKHKKEISGKNMFGRKEW